MTKDEALKLALEFIERVNEDGWILADFEPQMYATITAIKEALAQPEQEPVGKFAKFTDNIWREVTNGSAGVPLYTTPPAQQKPVLQDIEQYRMQMAGISTAAKGYWEEDDGIHPDYDTLAFRDVAALYAKYDALYKTQSVPHGVIAGALFDFMAWLTSRKERLVLSSADEASSAVDAIRDFAKMRGLSLDDARVQDWQDITQTIPQIPQEHSSNRQWVGLTEWEREAIALECGAMSADWLVFMEAVERALKEKNA